jgi:drug/metabolite transporter (DMT)-like permease
VTSRQASAVLFAVTVVWAGTFSAIKALLDHGVPAADIAVSRYLVAAPGFAAAYRLSGGLRGATRETLVRVVVAGLFVVTTYHIALNIGERHTTSGTAAVIIACAPAITLALSVALGLEVFSPRRVVGLAVAFGGVVIVILLGSGQEISFESAKGPLIVLIAAFSFAAYNVLAKPLIARHSAIAVSSAASLAGTGALLPFLSGDSVDVARDLSAGDWALILYLGLAATLAGYIAWTIALRALDPSRAVAFLYGIPVMAVVIGAVTLDETVTVWLAAGTVLVVGGIALTQARR